MHSKIAKNKCLMLANLVPTYLAITPLASCTYILHSPPTHTHTHTHPSPTHTPHPHTRPLTHTRTPYTHTPPTHTPLTVVTIGLEGDYSITEGDVQEVCAVLLTGSLERDAIVTLSTAEDGSATNSATGTLYRILLGFLCNL